MFYPLTFKPIFKDRVWGGRRLEQLYRKSLPPGVPIGESWEISDRPGDVSVIANGPLAGKDLHWVVENHPREFLGNRSLHAGRFPLLIKILDAQDKLSLQVHPPTSKAAALGGEPKTEMWYVAQAAAGANLYVGLKRGVTRTDFERRARQLAQVPERKAERTIVAIVGAVDPDSALTMARGRLPYPMEPDRGACFVVSRADVSCRMPKRSR